MKSHDVNIGCFFFRINTCVSCRLEVWTRVCMDGKAAPRGCVRRQSRLILPTGIFAVTEQTKRPYGNSTSVQHPDHIYPPVANRKQSRRKRRCRGNERSSVCSSQQPRRQLNTATTATSTIPTTPQIESRSNQQRQTLPLGSLSGFYRQRVWGHGRDEGREGISLQQNHEDGQDLKRKASGREVDLFLVGTAKETRDRGQESGGRGLRDGIVSLTVSGVMAPVRCWWLFAEWARGVLGCAK